MSDLQQQGAFQELQSLVQDRDRPLVVFVGAGVSSAAGLPGWTKLVADLTREAEGIVREDKEARLREIKALIERGKLVDALSAIESALKGGAFQRAVKKQLEPNGSPPQGVSPPPEIVSSLLALKPAFLVTTNLDCMLEAASAWPAVPRITSGCFQRGRVLKIHGTLTEPGTWVLTREAYDRALHDIDLHHEMLTLYTSAERTILFVGYGLVDDDFDPLLSYVRVHSLKGEPPSHYAIMTGVGPWRREMLANAGIRLLEYPNADGKHTEVAEILKALRPGPEPVRPPLPIGSGHVAVIKTCPWCHGPSSNVNKCSKCRRPTTCTRCGTPIEGPLSQDDHVYECRQPDCGNEIDRDPQLSPPQKSVFGGPSAGLAAAAAPATRERTPPQSKQRETVPSFDHRAVASAPSVGAEASRPGTRRQRYLEAEQMFRAGRHAAAVHELQQALKQPGDQPSESEILLLLAHAHRLLHDHDAALRNYLHVALTSPVHALEAWSQATPLIDAETVKTIYGTLQTDPGVAFTGPEASAELRSRALFAAKAHLFADNPVLAIKALDQVPWDGALPELQEEVGALADQIGQKLASLVSTTDNVAGQQRATDDVVRAYRLAHALRPSHMHGAWTLMDWLRVQSWIPEPPHARREPVAEAIAVWNGVAREGPLAADDSWAYVARATLNTQALRLADADRWELVWEGIGYCERAIVCLPNEAERHTQQAAFFRALGLEANQARAVERALALAPQSADVREEQLLHSVNSGDFAKAATLLEASRAVLKPGLADGIAAFILLRGGDPERALALIDGAMDDLGAAHWARELRAECLGCLGREQESVSVYRALTETPPVDLDDRSACAHAALVFGLATGSLAASLDLIEQARRTALPSEVGPEFWSAFADLAQGRVEVAQRRLLQALARERNSRTLRDLRDFDLIRIDRYAASWPHANEAATALALVRRTLETRLIELSARPPTAEQELETLLREVSTERAGSWFWSAANAVLARLRLEAGAASEAATLYDMVWTREPRLFPEGPIAIEVAMMTLRQRADSALAENAPGALDQYEHALRLTEDALPAALIARAELCARVGLAKILLQDETGAQAQFRRALEAFSAAQADGQALGRTCRALLPDVESYWRLDAAWCRWQASAEERYAKQIGLAITELQAYLDEQLGLAQNAAERPTFRPIILELGSALVAEDTGPTWILFADYIPALKRRIHESTGVPLPGIRVSGSQRGSGDYAIFVDQAFVAGGQTQPSARYVTLAELSPAGEAAPSDAAHVSVAPLSGERGVWLDAQHPALAEGPARGVDALKFCVDHLEAVLRQQLSRFVSLDPGAELLSELTETDAGSLHTLLKDDMRRRDLQRVLRSLVDDMVPLQPLPELLRCYLQLSAQSASSPLYERLRGELCARLPGNSPRLAQIWLSSTWVERLLAGGTPPDLFLEDPQQALALLTELREQFGGAGRATVLVVPPLLRAPVRRLIRPFFPWLPVMATSELVTSSLS